MKAQCPHCETRFRVTDAQIDMADGFVRCGVCEQVFNINNIVKQTTRRDGQTPLLHGAQLDEHAYKSLIEQANDHAHNISAIENTAHPATTENNEDNETISNVDTLPNYSSDKDTYNFFDDRNDDSMQHVVPEEFRDTYSSSAHPVISTVSWGIGILLLTATLFVEYAWFNRDQFTHNPQIQAEIDKLCQQFDCKNLSIRAPSKIELVSRNIYSHPNEKNALLVNVTMRNNATFSQPYPIMKIDFSDIRGDLVASRNFLPTEYLSAEHQNNSDKQRLLAPDSSSSITIEIQDPGKQAMAYEFNFI